MTAAIVVEAPRQQRAAICSIDRTDRAGATWKAVDDMMAGNGDDAHQDKAAAFREAALPHLDDVYTLARYLLRDSADTEDAVQNAICARCAISTRSADGIKPWLFQSCATFVAANFARRSPRHDRDG